MSRRTPGDGQFDPPAWAERLLSTLVPADDTGRSILGDLRQEFAQQVRSGGVGSARRAYVWRAIAIGARYVLVTRNRERAAGRGTAGLMTELRVAARSLVRQRLFAGVLVATIGLGVGAVTAMYAVVHGVLWRSLPYASSDRIVRVGGTFPDGALSPVSPVMYFDLRSGSGSFDALAGVYRMRLDLAGEGEPERYLAAGVSANFGEVFGVAPAVGRWFHADEDAAGALPVVVLSHGLWQRRWGGDASVVGRVLPLSGRLFTVVGVLGADFVPPEGLGLAGAEMWFPLAHIEQDLSDNRNYFIRVAGRLAEGVSAAAAHAELDGLTARLAASYDSDLYEGGFEVRVDGLREATVGDISTTLVPLFGAVALLLLIACANVSNLLIARNVDRAREFAVRTALGAGRVALIRQLLAESLLVSMAGGVLGIAIAAAGIDLFATFQAGGIPRVAELGIDYRVPAFALALAFALPLVFGLIPALRLRATGSVATGVRGVGATGSPVRTRTGLVVAETALALVLLAAAGLLVGSFARLVHVDPGFEVDGVTVMHVQATSRYATPGARLALFDELKRSALAVPGVDGAALTNALPFGDSGAGGSIEIEGRPSDEVPRFERWQLIDHEFLPAIGVRPLPGGRALTAADMAGHAYVVLINESFAGRYWPGGDAVGHRLQIISTGADAPWRTVIGVVPDFKQGDLAVAVTPEVYVPLTQSRVVFSDIDVVVRSEREAAVLADALRESVWRVDRSQPIAWVASLESRIGASTRRSRFYAVLVSVFAAVALLLAVVGIYGAVAWNVGRRTAELGIRMVMGASARGIVAGIVGRTAAVVGGGIVIGVVASIFLTKLLASLLFGVRPADPATFALVSCLLLCAGVVAAWLPARRAARIDPARSMRTD